MTIILLPLKIKLITHYLLLKFFSLSVIIQNIFSIDYILLLSESAKKPLTKGIKSMS